MLAKVRIGQADGGGVPSLSCNERIVFDLQIMPSLKPVRYAAYRSRCSLTEFSFNEKTNKFTGISCVFNNEIHRILTEVPSFIPAGSVFIDEPARDKYYIWVDEPLSIGFGGGHLELVTKTWIDLPPEAGRSFVRQLNVVFYVCESRLCGVRILDVAKVDIETMTETVYHFMGHPRTLRSRPFAEAGTMVVMGPRRP